VSLLHPKYRAQVTEKHDNAHKEEKKVS